MGKTKDKLRGGKPAFGGWIMTGNTSVAEVMAGEGFDFITVDMEHTANGVREFHDIALAAKGTGCDALARLPSCDPVLAKLVLDNGAAGIIVPSVNTPEQAAMAVAMAKFPPEGIRGASLCRATGFGSHFETYFRDFNRDVVVVVMLEHKDAVARADAILATPGIDAALIGPYDLSASMGIGGQIQHSDLLAAQQKILEACARHRVPPGIHVVQVDGKEVRRRVDQGFRFIACGLDTLFVRLGCRAMLEGLDASR